MRRRVVARLLGLLIVSIALNMIGALLWAIYFSEPVWKHFLLTIVLALILGFGLMWEGKKEHFVSLSRKEAMLMVGLGWFVAGLVGAVPFYISGHIPHYYDAFFETISGFTTTGASILTNIEAMPKGLLFWRSYTHWLGGMGIIVLFVALFPFLGVSGKKMYQFEVPGPDVGGLKPKIQSSAFILWAIYVGISVAETVALRLAGMPLYDAMCHTFGTMATGGFSTKNASIGFYTSPIIHIIIIVFMISAGANFSLYYLLLKKNARQVLRDKELQTYLAVIALSIVIFSVLLYTPEYYTSAFEAVVSSSFNAVSIMTTTGYATADTDTWPMLSKAWLLVLMFIGGCGGSTGGGIKVVRYLILIKYAYTQIITSYAPQRKIILKLSGRPVSQPVIDRTLSFFFLYLLIYGIGVLVIAGYGYDWPTTISSVAACLNNIGPGFSLVGATGNYAFMQPFAKVFLAVYMVAGRLELFALMIYVAPDFWKR
ncbi:TrkH family potassium uptake protein [candidate division KSB3 bacterium]|uniref:TrkH family potassium uptake protein n=1 Tax=candidate division KSB3 bacterium TaxID=2044937 RepID=A0A9D5JZX4_9BACT|nr:TrkH family potassium uptake protein [candidate division KSB3 bacterium]MBD3327377.1 TrkH family potassium uptake protein [candidate division KSB3 bacterium]